MGPGFATTTSVAALVTCCVALSVVLLACSAVVRLPPLWSLPSRLQFQPLLVMVGWMVVCIASMVVQAVTGDAPCTALGPVNHFFVVVSVWWYVSQFVDLQRTLVLRQPVVTPRGEWAYSLLVYAGAAAVVAVPALLSAGVMALPDLTRGRPVYRATSYGICHIAPDLVLYRWAFVLSVAGLGLVYMLFATAWSLLYAARHYPADVEARSRIRVRCTRFIIAFCLAWLFWVVEDCILAAVPGAVHQVPWQVETAKVVLFYAQPAFLATVFIANKWRFIRTVWPAWLVRVAGVVPLVVHAMESVARLYVRECCGCCCVAAGCMEPDPDGHTSCWGGGEPPSPSLVGAVGDGSGKSPASFQTATSEQLRVAADTWEIAAEAASAIESARGGGGAGARRQVPMAGGAAAPLLPPLSLPPGEHGMAPIPTSPPKYQPPALITAAIVPPSTALPLAHAGPGLSSSLNSAGAPSSSSSARLPTAATMVGGSPSSAGPSSLMQSVIGLRGWEKRRSNPAGHMVTGLALGQLRAMAGSPSGTGGEGGGMAASNRVPMPPSIATSPPAAGLEGVAATPPASAPIASAPWPLATRLGRQASTKGSRSGAAGGVPGSSSSSGGVPTPQGTMGSSRALSPAAGLAGHPAALRPPALPTSSVSPSNGSPVVGRSDPFKPVRGQPVHVYHIGSLPSTARSPPQPSGRGGGGLEDGGITAPDDRPHRYRRSSGLPGDASQLESWFSPTSSTPPVEVGAMATTAHPDAGEAGAPDEGIGAALWRAGIRTSSNAPSASAAQVLAGNGHGARGSDGMTSMERAWPASSAALGVGAGGSRSPCAPATLSHPATTMGASMMTDVQYTMMDDVGLSPTSPHTHVHHPRRHHGGGGDAGTLGASVMSSNSSMMYGRTCDSSATAMLAGMMLAGSGGSMLNDAGMLVVGHPTPAMAHAALVRLHRATTLRGSVPAPSGTSWPGGRPFLSTSGLTMAMPPGVLTGGHDGLDETVGMGYEMEEEEEGEGNAA